MIITVTLNPAIDKTIEIDGLTQGGLNKVVCSNTDPGGKGINVSKVIKSLGGESMATGLLGSSYIENALNKVGISHDFVRISGETRTNLKVFDRRTGETTEINESGPEVSMQDIDCLYEKIITHATAGSLIILSGSAPKSLPRDVYKTLIQKLKEKALKIFLDAEGDLFRQALEGKPHIIKPNRHELELYFERKLDTRTSLREASQHFIERGIEKVFISLGAEGAFYSDSKRSYYLNPLQVKAHSSVGAGDAFVGAVAYALENQYGLEKLLKMAVATSAGAVMTVGTKPMDSIWVLKNMEHVVVTAL
ncbi:1-phosphofructokinase [Fusibacter ferrireducens]|uniref:Tagatose-6-phosphate kinase n=1 Tax=Fusibacter ferrireducens TaxID=2785058 RepID=A0ABR9ZY35_9FIRM|nr:1-phosphofructokinase [Fusibacter ferrireducens]MBF4695286.1 1-phosphofructokinase [Fusibacter ferrireducens]